MNHHPTKDLTTPLKRAKNWGSAHIGVNHWLKQRITALALLILSLWFVLSLAHSFQLEYNDFLYYWAFPLRQILVILTMIAALYHAELGLSVIIEDYVHHPLIRPLLLILVKFLAILGGAIFIYGVLLLRLSV